MYALTIKIRNKDVMELAEIFTNKVTNTKENLDGIRNLRLNGQNKKFIRFLLAKMTSYIEIKSGLPNSFKPYLEDKYDIEHILPKNYFEKHKSEFENEDEFNKCRYKLGDLLILPSSFNRSYGAKPYECKVEHYFGQNLLAKSLNSKCYQNNPSFLKYLSSSKIPFKSYQQFGKAGIEERQELYEKLLKEIYNPAVFSKIASEVLPPQ